MTVRAVSLVPIAEGDYSRYTAENAFHLNRRAFKANILRRAAISGKGRKSYPTIYHAKLLYC